MKLESLLEQRSNKAFMLHLQQRLIDDLDVEAELEIEDERLDLSYLYEPGNDERHVTVSVSCELDGDNALVDVSFEGGDYDDQVELDIDVIMHAIERLTDQANDDLKDSAEEDAPD